MPAKFVKLDLATGRQVAASLEVADIAPSTTEALGVGSINLGHASDTTITRASAGVVAVEGSALMTQAQAEQLAFCNSIIFG